MKGLSCIELRNLAAASLIAAVAGYANAETVVVGNVSELHSAVIAANNSGGDVTISLEDGVYSLNDTLYIDASNVTLTSESKNRETVIIQGDAMSSNASVGNLLRVTGSHFELNNITLRRAGFHLIQIVGEADADYPIIRDCALRDAYEQIVKVSIDPSDPSTTSDFGLVENCIFEYTAGIGPQFDIGGIDAHGSKSWTVRDNYFQSIASPADTVSEFAIHFWNGSVDNTVERNLIVNCDRGIGFGLDGRGNAGGVIRNNMIYHDATTGQFGDTGIALIESPGTEIYNNTVFLEHGYPWAIEYRFPATQNVSIVNNLTNQTIQSRDGASAALASNITNADAGWFVATSTGDLHLSSPSTPASNAGQQLAGLTDDFDGQIRAVASQVDVGADEYGAMDSPPEAPSNLLAE